MTASDRPSSRTPAERPGPALLALRATFLAAATLAVASAAHVSADGNLPSRTGLFWIFVMATMIIMPWLARPASIARIVTLVCSGQLVLHLVLTVVAGHGPPVPRSEDAARYATTSMLAPHSHAPGTPAVHSHAMAGSGAEDVLGHLAAELTTIDGLVMFFSHLAGAAVVGLWLATGEKLLWSSLRAVARLVQLRIGEVIRRLQLWLLRLVVRLARTHSAVQLGPWIEPPQQPVLQRLFAPAPRRGPPPVGAPFLIPA